MEKIMKLSQQEIQDKIKKAIKIRATEDISPLEYLLQTFTAEECERWSHTPVKEVKAELERWSVNKLEKVGHVYEVDTSTASATGSAKLKTVPIFASKKRLHPLEWQTLLENGWGIMSFSRAPDFPIELVSKDIWWTHTRESSSGTSYLGFYIVE